MADNVIMPYDDYYNACKAIRTKLDMAEPTESDTTNAIKSGDMADLIDTISASNTLLFFYNTFTVSSNYSSQT